MKSALSSLCLRLGHDFSDTEILECALTHRSTGRKHNERVEFLGDAVLGLTIAEALYQRFPDADEGRLTRWRASLVREASLASVARGLGLGEWLRLGSGELKSGGWDRDSILADTLEAVFGAVYLDGGFAAAQGVILGLFANPLRALSAESADKDPKTKLQELLQGRGLPLPSYSIVSVDGQAHAQIFTCECRITGPKSLTGAGRGRSRREAEREAADQVLQALWHG